MNHDNIKLDLVDFDFDGDTVVGDYTVTISRDEFPEDPREIGCLGTMVCWHDRYNLGDKNGYETPKVFMHMLSGLYPDEATEDLTDEQIDRCHVFVDNRTIILPLYLYDHSGITMRATTFSCSWDSGLVGYIYVSKAKIREEFGVGRISSKLAKRVSDALNGEVEQYDQYLTGDVYGYNIVKDVDGDEVVIDSCSGFFGQENSGIEAYIREAITSDIENTPQQLTLV